MTSALFLLPVVSAIPYDLTSNVGIEGVSYWGRRFWAAYLRWKKQEASRLIFFKIQIQKFWSRARNDFAPDRCTNHITKDLELQTFQTFIFLAKLLKMCGVFNRPDKIFWQKPSMGPPFEANTTDGVHDGMRALLIGSQHENEEKSTKVSDAVHNEDVWSQSED